MDRNKGILKIIVILIFILVLTYLISNLNIFNKDSLLKIFTSGEEYRNFQVYFTVLISVLMIFFLPMSWCSALSAFFFGYRGFLYLIIGAIISAILSFYLAKIFRKDVLHIINYIYNRKKRKISLDQISSRIEKYGFSYVFVLRNIPIVPFNIANYICGISSVSTMDYFLGTLLGLMPTQFINIYFFVKAINIRQNPLGTFIAAIVKGIYILFIYLWQRKNKYWIKE